LALAFHRRRGGELLGYALGSPKRTILAGTSTFDGAITFTTDIRDPGLASTTTYSGTIDHDVIRVSDAAGAASPIELHRYLDPLVEERVILSFSDASGISRVFDFTAVLAADGSTITGAFVSRVECWPTCSGGVSAWERSGRRLMIGMDTTPCREGTVSIVFPSSGPGAASWAIADCMGPPYAATWSARPAPGSRSEDVLAILAVLGRIADDLEAGTHFGVPYDPFAAGYVDHGTGADTLFDAWNRELAAHAPVRVHFVGARQIATVFALDMSDLTPLWEPSQTVRFAEQRLGADDRPYYVNDTESGSDALAFLRQQPDGAWRMVGDSGR